ncbi:RNA polymerase sigma factor ShbA [Rhodococcus sp. NPDC049939]|uniref:RNA polymerase sigma factor ShbA n=1 Tax=Rhodococcus sp. NPDC049939 TaxID=3155511 RepID=UPI0033F3161A
MIELDLRAKLEALAPDAVNGDEAAVEEVLRIAYPLVYSFSKSRLEGTDSSHACAEDVTQDVCMALIGALPTYEDQGKSLLSFIFGIAAHKVCDARRRATRWSVTTARAAAAADPVGTEDSPEHHVLHRELRTDVGQLVEGLSTRHQQILFMRIVLGMSAQQTARVLDTTAGAVRVAQHRALNHLRERIGSDTAQNHSPIPRQAPRRRPVHACTQTTARTRSSRA